MKVLSQIALATLLLLVGCSNALDGAVRAANAAQAFGAAAEDTLAALYDTCLKQAVQESSSAQEAETRVAVCKERFAPAWKAYGAYRVAWIAVKDAIEAYNAAEGLAKAPDLDRVMRLIAYLVHTQAELTKEVDALLVGVVPSEVN